MEIRDSGCHHAAKALVENSSSRLSDEEIEAFLSDNPKAGTFVRDNFKGIFFAKGVHALIDSLRANCDRFRGFILALWVESANWESAKAPR